ncbi:MAG: hypothetical protein H8D38_01035 [DPANN group archaeon]|nr:hypothetical protein [DPANN group archaeon]
MSIIMTPDHKTTAEVEFSRRHPDIFATTLVARIVDSLAEKSDEFGKINKFRADLNAQVGALGTNGDLTQLSVSVAGQLIIPDAIDLHSAVVDEVDNLLSDSGYDSFGFSNGIVDIEKITSQAPAINGTTNSNKFADSCVVTGHYIQEPFGINGTFPALALGKAIDNTLEKIISDKDISELRPDGKVHITIRYGENDFTVEDVYLSVSHEQNPTNGFRERVKEAIISNNGYSDLFRETKWYINAGGDFSHYFVQADAGVSKVKDGVIINGGVHPLGTDGVWGKCLYKVSSTLIPYMFALSRTVSELLGASYASVTGVARYGQRDATFQLEEIDSLFEYHRQSINEVLKRVPRSRDEIREVLRMPVNRETYRLFNDVSGFHNQDKPWKKSNSELLQIFKNNY